MKRLVLTFLILAQNLALSSCASLGKIDRERVNHPAMRFDNSGTPALLSPLTGLGNLRAAAAHGGCTTCAH